MAAGLLDRLFGSPDLAAIFSDRGRLQGMLDFEAALAAAEARTGVIPAAAAPAIAAHCRAELFDVAALAESAAAGGNPAIPLVKELTALVAAADRTASGFVHWGATSQDAMDTGLVLQLRQALAPLDADLAELADALAGLAARHKATPMPGRTWLQHALPITFGLKAAGWLDAVERYRARLAAMKPHLLVLQFGGAAGTLAALGDQGLAVATALAAELDLALPALPWHSERDRLAEFAGLLGALTGTLGKMARDLSLLMQTDVGEVFEPAAEGRGGSSTMPHKRNPVASAAVLAAATRAPGLVATMLAAMVQEHERGLGNWPAEWTALPELVVLAGGALAQMRETMAGLEVDAARMRANIDATRGLMLAEAVTMALGARLGRQAAHQRIEAACRRAVAEGRHLRDILAADPVVSAELPGAALDRLFDPLNYLGSADAFVERVLAARRS
ncbi:MAG TPA: 3-carboxy-cis,cis-muconate cycloisomerase [Candidatus Sulfotelmatobacter sp.]|nr:3-carboxy-cis,cis-muconate cycloisomerase [Candidatus Sulfotelmatobacter sp.]